MKRKLMLLVACLFIGIGLASAQTRVTGTVLSSEDGMPIVGASILVKGTTIGTVTDLDGKFVLPNVPESANTLQVSFVGMKTQLLAIKETMVVKLDPDREVLDEVMVVAYGTAKKSSFTGSASTVRGEKIQKMQVSNVSKALEGTIAGVQTSSSSGTPGAGSAIIIRGLGSISSSQAPLIVVDGVPYEGSLNSISPQDIESLTVLKDAAANSMYGARGSNGVIMITTKGSKAGRAQIDFEARVGFNTRGVGNYDILSDAGQYYEMMYESYRNSLVEEMGVDEASKFAAANLISGNLKYNKFKGVADDQLIDPLTGKLNPAAREYKWNDDWQKDPFENGFRQEYNFNISGGSDNTQAYASLGYLSDEGIMVGSGFDRISGRVKVDQKIGKAFKVGGNIAYSNTNMREFGSTGSNYSNIFMFSQSIAPIYPIYKYDKDGNLMYDEKGNVLYDFDSPYAAPQNPYAVAKENINEYVRDNLSTRAYLEAKFLNDFKITVNLAYDLFNNSDTEYTTPIGGDAQNVGGRGYKYATRYGALNLNQLLNWSHDFGKHHVSVLLGHESKNDYNRYMRGHMTQFADPYNPEFSNAAHYEDLTSNTSEYALEGYFGKLEYDFSDKYYFTASYRRDGSSRFHKDNRWGSFWAVGASWRIKEEAFMKDVDFISSLKLKTSYGTQGNDNVGYSHNYSDLYEVGRVGGMPGFTKVLRGNKDLTWEKSRNFNLGIEAGLWNRVNFNFDFFIKETKDMLFKSPLPSSEGSPSWIYRNEMDMKNTGVEFELNADIIKNDRMTWNVSFNGTHYKNELTKLPDSKPADLYPDGYQAGSYWRKIGGSLYDFYDYEYVGVDPENGKPMYNKYVEDENGNETIEIVNKTSDATLRETGKSAIPDFVGGLGTTFQAFGVDLSIQTAFQLGGYVYDSFYSVLMNSGQRGHNFHKDMLNRWTPENKNTNVPALKYLDRDMQAGGTFSLTKASYFSLRNLTVGYTLPTSLMRKVGIQRLRFYLTGDNIWLKSKRKGLDPRQGFGGGTGYVYSALSTYSFGMNLTL